MQVRNLDTNLEYEVDASYRPHRREIVILDDGTELDWQQYRAQESPVIDGDFDDRAPEDLEGHPDDEE